MEFGSEHRGERKRVKVRRKKDGGTTVIYRTRSREEEEVRSTRDSQDNTKLVGVHLYTLYYSCDL